MVLSNDILILVYSLPYMKNSRHGVHTDPKWPVEQDDTNHQHYSTIQHKKLRTEKFKNNAGQWAIVWIGNYHTCRLPVHLHVAAIHAWFQLQDIWSIYIGYGPNMICNHSQQASVIHAKVPDWSTTTQIIKASIHATWFSKYQPPHENLYTSVIISP